MFPVYKPHDDSDFVVDVSPGEKVASSPVGSLWTEKRQPPVAQPNSPPDSRDHSRCRQPPPERMTAV